MTHGTKEAKTSIVFPPEFLNELRLKNPVESVIADYVTLTKKGKSLKGICPFHTEETASFSVQPDGQFYYCFGCKRGGDVYKFIIDRENLSFIEAVKFLADRSGTPIPAFINNEAYNEIIRSQDKILKLNKLANEHWQSNLENAPDVRQYLRDRGITEEIEKVFGFGYSVDDWKNLKTELKKEYTNADIKLSGLTKDNQDGTAYYDLFRNRLMMPILDVRGRVVAFGGRGMNDTPPKYINSPETPLYTKGDHLFGLYQTKEIIRKKGFAILTEGYLDLIALYQHGVNNVVASLGTALTEAQAKMLRRFTNKVVICYDGDNAGLTAAERVSRVLVQEGFTIKIMVIPDKKDPDDYIRQYGKAVFDKRRQKSEGWFRFTVERIKSTTDFSNPVDKARAVEEVLNIVSKSPSIVEKGEYFDIAMRLMKVDSKVAAGLWKKLAVHNHTVRVSEMVIKPSAAEIRFLELIVCNNESRAKYITKLQGWTTNLIISPVIETIAVDGQLNYIEIEEKVTDKLGINLLREALIKSEETIVESGENLEEELEMCINALARIQLEAQLEDISKKIKSETDEKTLFGFMDEEADVLLQLSLTA